MVISGHINAADPAALAASTANLDPKLCGFHFDVDWDAPGIGARAVGEETGPETNCDADPSRLIFANTI